MAIPVAPLTDTKCNNSKPKEKDYKLFDGGGLYLLVKANGSKTWKMKYYKLDGKETTLSIGNYPDISLKDARDKRQETKELLAKDIDPAVFKKQKRINAQNATTFKMLADSWIQQTEQEKNWKPVHTKKMTRIIDNYLLPSLAKRDITGLTFNDLIAPIQHALDKRYLDIAKTLRQTLISIMRHAIFKGIITTNPALDLIGLKINAKKKHRPALPIEQIGELAERLYNYPHHAITKYALLINIQLFIRSSELRFARWSEIDLKNKLWTIPADRTPIDNARGSNRGTKMMTQHLVPLSTQTTQLLQQLKQMTGSYDLIFTYNGEKPLSENVINQALKKIGYDTSKDICGHGFRTMACSALIESGQFSKDAIERQMSHQERNGVRAAYIHKAEHLDERIRMMQWWSDYIDHVREKGYIAPYQFKNKN